MYINEIKTKIKNMIKKYDDMIISTVVGDRYYVKSQDVNINSFNEYVILVNSILNDEIEMCDKIISYDFIEEVE